MRCLLMAGTVLLIALACGCDVLQRDGAEGARVNIQFGLVDGAAGSVPLDGCATSIQSVLLTVNGREFRQDVAAGTVVFEVRDLPRGDLLASAVVFSNTGDTLFAGEDRRSADSDDFGTITIRLEKVHPVLQVCPDTLTLSVENDFTGLASIENRDARPTGTMADTLRWRAVEPRVCINDRCVYVEPSSGMAIVPQPEQIFIGGEFAQTEEIFEMAFESPYGRTPLYVRVVPADFR